MNLRTAFTHAISSFASLEKKSKVIIGVSGGIDSMVLLDLIVKHKKAWGLSIVAGHVNYGLRGRASKRDEEIVRRAAKRYQITVEVLNKDLAGIGNLQNTARKIRYDFFKKLAAQYVTDKILTAHHLDDQAETVLLHLIRGSGLKGLSGIRPVTEIDGIKIIRPMLYFSKDDIKVYARLNDVKYGIDATNLTDKYSRNSVRNKLIPMFTSYNPRINTRLANIADMAHEEEEALTVYAKEAENLSLLSSESGTVRFDRDVYLNFPRAIRVRLLRLLFMRLCGTSKDLNSDHLMRMDSIAARDKGAGQYRLPYGIVYVRKGNELHLKKL